MTLSSIVGADMMIASPSLSLREHSPGPAANAQGLAFP
jgi:hypothetical protein